MKLMEMTLNEIIKERLRKLNAGEIKCGNEVYCFGGWENAIVIVTLKKKNGVWVFGNTR